MRELRNEPDEFAVDAITWIPGDEEEDDCIFIEGTARSDATVAAGVELTATAYDAGGGMATGQLVRLKLAWA